MVLLVRRVLPGRKELPVRRELQVRKELLVRREQLLVPGEEEAPLEGHKLLGLQLVDAKVALRLD